MKLSTWLNNERGRSAAMARHFGLTPAAVHQWVTNGVPRDRMLAVRAYTDSEVSLDEMLSDTVEPAGDAGQLSQEA